MFFRLASLGVIGALLAGCAVHPLPEDYSGVTTVEVVRKIRCETRHAIQDVAIELLLKTEKPSNIELAQALQADRRLFQTITADQIRSDDARKFYNKYIDTGLALNFTFNLTEDNQHNLEVDFAKLITNGTVSLKTTARNELMRNSNRQFIVSDKFSGILLDKKLAATCMDGPEAENIVYPMAGRIGLREVIRTFVGLNEDFGDDGKLSNLVDKSGVFADQLVFTTTIGGSINPEVMINTMAPASPVFRLTDAMVNTTNTRTDENTVIVGLSLAPRKDAPLRVARIGGPFGGVASTTTVFGKTDVSRAETQAIEATVQKRYDTFLQNFSRNVP